MMWYLTFVLLGRNKCESTMTKTYLVSNLFLIVFTLSTTGCAVIPPKTTKIFVGDNKEKW